MSKAVAGTERDLLGRILVAWAKAGASGIPDAGFLATRVLYGYALSATEAVRAISHNPTPVDLASINAWIIGPPTPGEPPMYPVATAAIRNANDGTLELTIRVALFSSVLHDEVDFAVQGWRFESREPDRVDEDGVIHRSPRPFPHAQPVVGWHISGTCLLHPHKPDESEPCGSDPPWPTSISGWRESMNMEQPGFPLRGDGAVAQSLATLVALYGVVRAEEILFENDSELRTYLEQPTYAPLLQG